MRCHAFSLAALLVFSLAPVQAADRRPIAVEDLFRCQRVSDPQISPDGKQVAYVLTTVDLEGDRTASSIWLAPTDGKGQPRPLTNAAGKKDRHPRWSPDGQRLLFESNRSGETQLWVIDVAGGEARQLTTVSTGAANALWSPNGTQIAFVSAVWPEYSDKPFHESDAANKKRLEQNAKNPVKAKIFTKLFARHWDSYVEDKRQHLFVMSFNQGKAGEPKDVTPGDRDAFPTSDTFETGDNFTFSPDSKFLVFTAAPAKDEAWSTNYDICRVPITGGTKEWEYLTKDNLAADSGPKFSPDGKKLAYRAQKKPGYEADEWKLMMVDCAMDGMFKGKPEPEKHLDNVDEYVWWYRGPIPNHYGFLYITDKWGSRPLWAASMNPGTGEVAGVSGEIKSGFCGSLSTNKDRTRIAIILAKMKAPAEVYVCDGKSVGEAMIDGEHFVQITHANDALLAELDMTQPESIKVPLEKDVCMQMWILKPPGFDAKKKWPLVYLVHGGPQGAWEDGWHYRWNPQVWAAQGYVVAMPNPRGSTGFGQKFVEEITGDWGGKCYDDLMAGVSIISKN